MKDYLDSAIVAASSKDFKSFKSELTKATDEKIKNHLDGFMKHLTKTMFIKDEK